MRNLIVVALLTLACACAPVAREAQETQDTSDSAYPGYEMSPDTGLPTNPSKRRLPSSVKVVSDTQKNFGIDISALTADQASIVQSAWTSYETILSGAHPNCSQAPFAPADGGTTIYFCDGYNIVRVHSMSGTVESPGYDYGPSLDLLNGQRVKRLKFYAPDEMKRFNRTAP